MCRAARLQLLATPPTRESLANQLAMLASLGHADEWLLCIVPPFRDSSQIESAFDQWRSVARDATQILYDARWRGALVWWLPRQASTDEWQQAREATAQHMLLHDPQLQDNRRGRRRT
jgi:hypothetical protein